MSLLDEIETRCPYCDSAMAIEIEAEMLGQAFIEDCPICCSPVEFELHVGPDGEPGLNVRRDDDTA